MYAKEALELALEQSEKLSIIYEGGSQAGKARVIAPLSINGDKVRARCYNSEKVKVFLISKIRLPSADTPNNVSSWEVGAKFEFSNLKELHEVYLDSLESVGWVVKLGEDSLSLHKKFKNGKTRAASEIELTYCEYTVESFIGLSGEIETLRKNSSRPWALRAKNFDTVTYSKFESAASSFLNLVKERSF